MKKDKRTQDPRKEVQAKKFLTFVAEKIVIEGDEQQLPRASIGGYFALCTVMAKGLDRDIEVENLTPVNNGVLWKLPAWFFENMRVDELTARNVVNKLQEMFKLPFLPIPAKPLDLPLQKIPPSKRDKIVEAAIKERLKEYSAQSPDKDWEDT